MVYIPGPGYKMPPKKYAEILNENEIKLIESEKNRKILNNRKRTPSI